VVTGTAGGDNDTTRGMWSPTAFPVAHFGHKPGRPDPDPNLRPYLAVAPLAAATLDGVIHLAHAGVGEPQVAAERFSLSGVLTASKTFSADTSAIGTSFGYGTLAEAGWTRQAQIGGVQNEAGGAMAMARFGSRVALLFQPQKNGALHMTVGQYVRQPYVVAVSGLSGSGKSSVIQRTLELLGDAVAIQFDDYASVGAFPEDLKEWLARGADVDAFQTPHLANDLRTLRSGASVTLPGERGVVLPAAFILVEEPFGRMRAEMAPLIDFAAHLEVPADMIFARRLLRRLEEERHLGDALYGRLENDLHRHLAEGRELDARGAVAIRAAADVVLDGMRTVDEIAQTLAEHIRERRTTA
jgi:uridine kinase